MPISLTQTPEFWFILYKIALSAAVTGNAGLVDYETMFGDSRILDLARKIRVCESEELTSWSPAKRASKVTVKLDDGKQYSILVEYALGEPENQMSQEVIVNKFMGLAKYAGLDDEKINEIINKILIQ